MRTAMKVVVLAAVIVGLCGALSLAEAQLADCRDYVTGIGTIPSATGSSFAAFALAVGYKSPKAPLRGLFTAADPAAGFSIVALNVQTYGGYNCFTTQPCYDRVFTGDAYVNLPDFSGVRPYFVEVIDDGPFAPGQNWIDFNSTGYINIGLLNHGDIEIHNQSTAPGCQ